MREWRWGFCGGCDDSVGWQPFFPLLGSSLASRKTSSELLSLWSLSLCSSLSTRWMTHSRLLWTFNQIFSCTQTHIAKRFNTKQTRKEESKRQVNSPLTHSSSAKSVWKEARLFLIPSVPSGYREGAVVTRDGEGGCREGERDGEREEGEREEDGDGVPRWAGSGQAAARARMAEDSSLESHTVTSWRVCVKRVRDDALRLLRVREKWLLWRTQATFICICGFHFYQSNFWMWYFTFTTGK